METSANRSTGTALPGACEGGGAPAACKVPLQNGIWNMKIAVVGAGIGGLALASLAGRAGHQVCLWERFEQPRPLGSGLVIQPVGLAVLDLLGVGAEARALGAPIARMQGHLGNGRSVLDVSYRGSAPGLAMHRSALFNLLWQAAQAAGVAVRTGMDIHTAPQVNGRRTLCLQDGTPLDDVDLVVDASGAGSKLSPLKARPLGFGAIWGTVPWPAHTPLPANELRQRYRAASRMVGVLPVGRMHEGDAMRAAVFWSMPTPALAGWHDTSIQAWRQEAEELWPEVAPFLATITDTRHMTPARYAHGTLRLPYAPGLAFIGDAAHRASPQLGQGANMALLDAQALFTALQGHTLSEALPRYAALRRWHVRMYQTMSALFTPMYQSDSRTLPLLRDHLLAPAMTLPGVPRLLTALVSGDLLPP
jgi:2-polyprenyl-6-methoxyphenol hydroxylase-like FAD-dependent oxidoreductase